MEDIKYFQNELTNVNSKIAAIKLSYIQENPDLTNSLLKDLGAVERNFKLAKEESLMNIEKAKIEKEADSDVMSSFKAFMETFKTMNKDKG